MITPIPRPEVTAARRLRWRMRTPAAGVGLVLAAVATFADDGPLGRFTGHTDIGAPKQAGTVSHDAATGDYVIGGGGANMWFKSDSFHFVWQKVEGDIALEADIAFPQSGGNNHRKGVLMIRQSLEADSAYADVAVHGDGLTSLQFREAVGDVTHEVQGRAKAPKRVRLEKIGNYVYFSLIGEQGGVRPTGCSARVVFKTPFYVGLGVCAHDDQAFETVRFGHVVTGAPSPAVAAGRNSVEYVKVPSGDRVCVHPSDEPVRDLNWGADGVLNFSIHEALISIPLLDSPHKVDQVVFGGSQPTAASPDGKWTAALAHEGGDAVLTLRPAAGGDARVLMRLPDQADAPLKISWSFDSTKIAYIRTQPASTAR